MSIKDCKILITGLVRNASKSIIGEVSIINAAFSSFKSVQWLVIESDSSDDTVAELQNIKSQNKNFDFLALGNLAGMYAKRTERLAYCRNIYLREIRENPKYSDVNFVAVVDLDGVNNLLTAGAVNSCWDRNDWAVCAANQLGPYYDIWALRHPIWCPNDCWEQCRFLEYFGLSHDSAKQASVYSRQIVIPPEVGWIEVDSAFGGLAIYDRLFLESGQYCGLSPYGDEICDHPSLHQEIRNKGGKIFINPKLINTSFTEHTQHLNKKSKFLYL
jgi:hypothetical protein